MIKSPVESTGEHVFIYASIFMLLSIVLEGKINLIVEKLNTTSSKITVNTRYTLIRTVVGTGGIDMNYRPIQTNQVETIGFDFNSKGVFNGGTECVATGRLEQEILSLVE